MFLAAEKVGAVAKGHDGPIMVMTHHNPWDTVTTKPNDLFRQVEDMLGRQPTLWYWGHVHNGIVYDKADGPQTKGRCCGHGAVPFGDAWGLTGSHTPLYYAHTPDAAFEPGSPRVYNGYASVTFSDKGEVTETFYEVRNIGEAGEAVWSKTWSPNETN